MDPVLTEDGKYYAPERFKEIQREKYLISKRIHTSILDLDQITPREREIYLELISEEIRKEKEEIDKFKK